MGQSFSLKENYTVMGRKACIQGMPVTARIILTLLVSGKYLERIITYYPYLESNDNILSLKYTIWLTEER